MMKRSHKRLAIRTVDKEKRAAEKQPKWKQQGWGRGWDRDLVYVQLANDYRA